MDKFSAKITKIRVCTFEMSGKIPDSANLASEPVILTPPHPLFTIFGCASGQISENMRVLAPLGLVTLIKMDMVRQEDGHSSDSAVLARWTGSRCMDIGLTGSQLSQDTGFCFHFLTTLVAAALQLEELAPAGAKNPYF